MWNASQNTHWYSILQAPSLTSECTFLAMQLPIALLSSSGPYLLRLGTVVKMYKDQPKSSLRGSAYNKPSCLALKIPERTHWQQEILSATCKINELYTERGVDVITKSCRFSEQSKREMRSLAPFSRWHATSHRNSQLSWQLREMEHRFPARVWVCLCQAPFSWISPRDAA